MDLTMCVVCDGVVVADELEPGNWTALCTECCMSGPACCDEESAVHAWNRICEALTKGGYGAANRRSGAAIRSLTEKPESLQSARRCADGESCNSARQQALKTQVGEIRIALTPLMLDVEEDNDVRMVIPIASKRLLLARIVRACDELEQLTKESK